MFSLYSPLPAYALGSACHFFKHSLVPFARHKSYHKFQTLEEQSPPSPEQLPLPQPNSIFDVEVSPLSVSHSNNNVNSAVEAPLSDDETLEVTDEVEREIGLIIS